MKSYPIVRQIQNNTCTIAVIRAILLAYEKTSYSEDYMIKAFPYLFENGCTPYNLSIKFWKERGYCSEKVDNQIVSNIAAKTANDNTYAMVTLEPTLNIFHCILFGYTCDKSVYYMDPDEKGSGLTCKSISDFEELRKIKSTHPSCTIREVVYVWNKNAK